MRNIALRLIKSKDSLSLDFRHRGYERPISYSMRKTLINGPEITLFLSSRVLLLRLRTHQAALMLTVFGNVWNRPCSNLSKRLSDFCGQLTSFWLQKESHKIDRHIDVNRRLSVQTKISSRPSLLTSTKRTLVKVVLHRSLGLDTWPRDQCRVP